MKAWTDLENDKDVNLYFTGLESDPDSRWYISPGVKIEKFRDGTIEIKRVYGNQSWYSDITSSQMMYFEEHGWWAGVAKVNVDWFSDKASSLEDPTIAEEKLKYWTDRLNKILFLQ